MKPSAAPGLFLCLGLVASCAQPPAPEPAAETPAATAPSEPPVVLQPTAEEETAGRDLTQLVVCELLPGSEVAEFLGGVLYARPSPTVSGTMWNECAYLIRLDAAKPEAKLVTVRFYSPEHYELARQLAEEPEDAIGVGHEAFLTEEPPHFVLTALQHDDVALEVRTETSPGDALALAALVLERLLDLPPA